MLYFRLVLNEKEIVPVPAFFLIADCLLLAHTTHNRWYYTLTDGLGTGKALVVDSVPVFCTCANWLHIQ